MDPVDIDLHAHLAQTERDKAAEEQYQRDIEVMEDQFRAGVDTGDIDLIVWVDAVLDGNDDEAIALVKKCAASHLFRRYFVEGARDADMRLLEKMARLYAEAELA